MYQGRLGRARGWPWRRLLTAALAAVAIFVYWSKVAERGEQTLARDNAGFASAQRLDEHYAKHGAEFGSISREDYLGLAQKLRDAPVGGPILEAVRKDGVVTRFDRDSGAFIAFNRDRTIRTFFKPNDGERYWRRQMERDPR
jgi:pyocin large subunit-like protein